MDTIYVKEDRYSRFNDDGYGIRPISLNGKDQQENNKSSDKSGRKAKSGYLVSYGEETRTIFHLFGTDENGITKSLSWVLSRCSEFNRCIVNKAFGNIDMSEEYVVFYQRYSSDNGITDIEITDNDNYHLIIEAKKGWNLPLYNQLQKYSCRKDFINEGTRLKKIISMSECSTEYADNNLPKEINGIEIIHMSWNDVFDCAKEARKKSINAEKKMLDELCVYLKEVIGMQNYLSNEVYCVALSDNYVCEGSSLRWVDIVNKYKKYTCPQGHSWPVEPPNYIAFRYKGKVQSIHHIDSYIITNNIHNHISEYPDINEEYPYFIFSLGEAIIPAKDVKSGKYMWSRRVWVMIDLLLTCDTVEEAIEETKKRKKIKDNEQNCYF